MQWLTQSSVRFGQFLRSLSTSILIPAKLPMTKDDYNDEQNEEELSVRREIFSIDQLERLARSLASSHRVIEGRAPNALLPRLAENEKVLGSTYQMLTEAVTLNRHVAPAAEWLLDNFYIIDDHIRLARRHLPRTFQRELPWLPEGKASGYPRVYSIAMELISHVDGQIDSPGIDGFVSAYQSVAPLKIGELWGVPIMLRLALIENLRRVALRIARRRFEQELAIDWFERMVDAFEKNPTDLIMVVADLARENPPFTGAFLAELTRNLRGQSRHFSLATSWLEQRLLDQGTSLEQLVTEEGQAAASDQVSIGNCITSLRYLGAANWEDFVEHHSIMEQLLREDPARVYGTMDFATRDHYRHMIEKLAATSFSSEDAVARAVLELARNQADTDPTHRTAHIGYYLIDRGKPALEQLIHMRRPLWRLAAGVFERHPLFFYLLGVFLVTLAIAGAMLRLFARSGLSTTMVSVFMCLTLVLASHIAVNLVNWLAALLTEPRPPPRLNFHQGIPDDHRTIVVVPTILSSPEGVQNIVDGLEIRYLANRDANLCFALLSDFEDAPQQSMAIDETLLTLACQGIERLNAIYSNQLREPFFLFHRERLWNDQEGVWMGFERKRGKLAALNALLGRDSLHGYTGEFSKIVGDVSLLADIKYVITLDTDTQLPLDAAYKIVGSMAHILNRPVTDPTSRRIVDGYSILQPRIGVSLPSYRRSWFSRLTAEEPGIDPYTRLISNVYQDLFGEGSFIGKGIYDLSTFERQCADFPENAILSHDLLEGTYARSALVCDVLLYEDYPSSYLADAGRRHRWVRGDWQLIWWLFFRVPTRGFKFVQNPISALSWWKIFDNLRRSLEPVAMMVLLLLSCALLSSSGLSKIGFFVLMTLASAPLLSVLSDVVQKSEETPPMRHLAMAAASSGIQLGRLFLSLICLPHEAYLHADAIGRTLLRVFLTKRKLLEWKSSFRAERETRGDFLSFLRVMWLSPLLAVALIAITIGIRPLASMPLASFVAIVPFVVLWFFSPLVAFLLSRPIRPRLFQPSLAQSRFLGGIARRTFRFFETFVAERDNFLPPDNVQEYPALTIASRTSPTNIGMALLSNLSAHDLGYLSVGGLLERTRSTLGTLGRLERHHGHFLNWYDTQSLRPLFPQYVSTVDSGNLVGHLLTLKSGLLELIDGPILPPRILEGLRDTIFVLIEEAKRSYEASGDVKAPEILTELIRRTQRVDDHLHNMPNSLNVYVGALTQIKKSLAEFLLVFEAGDDIRYWLTTIERMCNEFLADIFHLAGWLAIAPPPEELWQHGSEQHRGLLSELKALLLQLDCLPTLAELTVSCKEMLSLIEKIFGVCAEHPIEKRDKRFNYFAWLENLRDAVVSSLHSAQRRKEALEYLAGRCGEFSQADFLFLYNSARRLFTIGYNLSTSRFDSGFYDLLASEARLASFIAIAQGQLGQEHWFALARNLTTSNGTPVLLSWSGSIFEYLMPLLVMPNFEQTLLDQTYKAVVQQQINYGKQKSVPWGISESGFNLVDVQLNYQYRAFGVPGMGLKRGLADDLVIAPYASALALMVGPDAACQNLQRLYAEGKLGPFGFYEAIDYTPSRLPRNTSSVTVRQFMAHHQGMVLTAIGNLLLGSPMQRRFMAEPMLRAAELLLQERIPKLSMPVQPHVEQETRPLVSAKDDEMTVRLLGDLNDITPEVHLLSNGRYLVVVTAAGGGYSRHRDLAITRWREDPTRDCWGSFCYIRDLDSGIFWSTTWQPTLKRPKFYEAAFSKARADFRRSDEGIDSHTELVVSPEDDIELRRTSITNRSVTTRTIELTSYSEIVLAPQANDLTHPAFGNLFIKIELMRELGAFLCTRRARSADDSYPWMIHLMNVKGKTLGKTRFESDRMKFIGRGRNLVSPAAMDRASVLTDSDLPVTDPVSCIRQVIQLEPGETAIVDVVTGVAQTKQEAITLAEKYHDPRLTGRVFELAWTHNQIVLRQLGATEAEARTYCRLAGLVIYTSPLLRADSETLLKNRRSQSGLWGYGISGDLPIVLVRIREGINIGLISQLVGAHSYLRMKGIKVELVIWNEDDSTYRQALQEAIVNVIATSSESSLIDKPGGIFVRRGDQVSPEDRSLMLSVARVILRDDRGSLTEQLDRVVLATPQMPVFRPARRHEESVEPPAVARPDLLFFNGFGGFIPGGKEYVTILPPTVATPAPWVNVIANPTFGTVVSESGSVYTWAQNSHEFRLTPWSNDPVTDISGEAFYIRDEYSGRFWSPTPSPCRGLATYFVRHGFGYTIFEYNQDGIASELTLFVDKEASVKFARFRITNRSKRKRLLSLTGYFEWVLGEFRDKTLMHITCQRDALSGAIFARNSFNAEFADMMAFVDCSEAGRTITTDRTEFIGRNGTLANPLAMHRTRLSGQTRPGSDSCAAIQIPFSLEHDEHREIIFILGSANSELQARELISRFCSPATAGQSLEEVQNQWQRVTGVIQVETPDPALNILANGWLIYQVLSCRMWGRTGFYQSGGAFGFRDQLQDAMAMAYVQPTILREHLLLSASRQFIEGDVQHWWHPPVGRGVRTRCSDDFLWLPYATCHYISVTGDSAILDVKVPFLSARSLRLDEAEYYDLPRIAEETGTLYEHCVRAINNGLRFGSHGLPLMGTGDWNDGMNLVGAQGKGESVWLAFFLCDVIAKFIELAQRHGDVALAESYAVELGRLRGHIEESAWDGAWYLRAFFDDGEPLGSNQNAECQIDSLPQSWSVLSGASMSERAKIAMDSAHARLVDRHFKLIKLFDPPFDKSAVNPGYIKGYLPGVRENGGQYTHGALWMVMAYARMGESEKAFDLFSLINPIHHGDSPAQQANYRVEPYVMAGDVYASEAHAGRGGWSWYSGSAGWMYRLLVESILGVTLIVDKLTFMPHVPRSWRSYKVRYHFRRDTTYEITVHNEESGNQVKKVIVDGKEAPDNLLILVDDLVNHKVDIYLGKAAAVAPP